MVWYSRLQCSSVQWLAVYLSGWLSGWLSAWLATLQGCVARGWFTDQWPQEMAVGSWGPQPQNFPDKTKKTTKSRKI